MDWYRRYNGTGGDAKFRVIAAKLKETFHSVTVRDAIAWWDLLLETANERPDDARGSIDGLDMETAALTLDLAIDLARAIHRQMRTRGLHDGKRILNWSKRNPDYDHSAKRTQEWRDRKKAAPGAGRDVTVASRDDKRRGDEERTEYKSIEESSLDAPRASASTAGDSKNIQEIVPLRADARPSRPRQPAMLLPISGDAPERQPGGNDAKNLKRQRWLQTLGDYVRDVEVAELERFWSEAQKPADEARIYLNELEKRMHASFWWKQRTGSPNQRPLRTGAAG